MTVTRKSSNVSCHLSSPDLTAEKAKSEMYQDPTGEVCTVDTVKPLKIGGGQLCSFAKLAMWGINLILNIIRIMEISG